MCNWWALYNSISASFFFVMCHCSWTSPHRTSLFSVGTVFLVTDVAAEIMLLCWNRYTQKNCRISSLTNSKAPCWVALLWPSASTFSLKVSWPGCHSGQFIIYCISCCAERYQLCVEILENLSKVPRFQTITMFLGKQERTGDCILHGDCTIITPSSLFPSRTVSCAGYNWEGMGNSF